MKNDIIKVQQYLIDTGLNAEGETLKAFTRIVLGVEALEEQVEELEKENRRYAR